MGIIFAGVAEGGEEANVPSTMATTWGQKILQAALEQQKAEHR